ncbi:mitochondrial ribosomal protein S31 [Arctopsyche grandis]|uniref:mitochondrial ribosomal protein S31 n=1 Tax=Arctopsyche grandis TaxID=121162 RepID=UPI00406D860D
MLHLRTFRPIFVDNIKKNITRTFCSKSSGDGDPVSSAEPSNEEKPKSKEELTNKINDILKSMIEANAQPQNVSKPKLPVENYGFQKQKRSNIKSEFEESMKNIKDAAASVAKSFGDDPNVEKELIAKATEVPNQITNLNWGQLIDGMQIDNTESTNEYVAKVTRSQQVRSAMSKNVGESYNTRTNPASFTSRFKIQSVHLLDGKPLGIFTKDFEGSAGVELAIWKDLEEYENNVAIAHPPENYFDKMIQWTNQGKIWKFPIDNEQGIVEERDVHFSDHVFLEGHLKDWCPARGPIRHFMELVCIGMSKNSYMPYKDKREHIEWFKNYFESKRELLEQVGAYGNSVNESKPMNV